MVFKAEIKRNRGIDYQMLPRVIKVISIFLFFTAFTVCVLIGITILYPFLLYIEKAGGKKHFIMQEVNRRLFYALLLILRPAGVIRAKPYKGAIYEGPCIMISNHPSYFDVIFLIALIPRMSVLVKRTLVQKLPLGPIIRASGYLLSPDIRSGSPLEILAEASERINQGYKFLIFPEGTRSPAGGLHDFKAGGFKIAQKLNVPIQPIIVRNNPPLLFKGARWYLPPEETSFIEVEFLDPIPPPKKGEERKIADELERKYRSIMGIE